MIVIVMGVSGAGKTTVGRRLADELGWRFADADGFHPPANIAKMQAGVPLTDSDRAIWLDELHRALGEWARAGRPIVLACSALRAAYRAHLAGGLADCRFVYLAVDYETAAERVRRRRDHFMPPTLLQSQFALLEEPQDALVVDGTAPVQAVVRQIRNALPL